MRRIRRISILFMAQTEPDGSAPVYILAPFQGALKALKPHSSLITHKYSRGILRRGRDIWYNTQLMLEVTILSVLQGVAEFLPISSSGHLVIGQHFLGVNDPGMRLDVFLHFGTLIAICVYYRLTLAKLLISMFARGVPVAVRRSAWMYALKIIASAIPAVVVYLTFKKQIDGLFENAKMVGALLMFTGAVLIGTRYLPRGSKDVSFMRALLMGLAQAIAILPGVSRSGMTLAAARGGFVDSDKAAEFSFLMSAPLIAGGSILELAQSFGESAGGGVGWGLTLYGTLVAAVVGYFSLALLVKALKGKKFWWFGIYCLAAGLFTLILV